MRDKTGTVHLPAPEIARALMENKKTTAKSHMQCFQNYLSKLNDFMT